MKPPQAVKTACLLCAALLQAVNIGAQSVTKIAAGDDHSLFLKSDGSLWAMGYNDGQTMGVGSGQLGDGTYNNTNRPELIVSGNVTAVAGGFFHSLFVKSDGSLWAMGWEMDGQLGDGTMGSFPYYSTNRPVQIVASNVTAVAGGFYHSLFLKNDGSLWAMGGNEFGQLGDGTYNQANQPEQIVASNVTAIAAGQDHSLFLKSDGSLWAMGGNSEGELGDGTYNNTNQPEEIVASNVVAIAAENLHSLFLKNDGSLWAMGDNVSGQLGDGSTNNTDQPEQIVASNVIAIAAGGYHSVLLESGGSLWTMGDNVLGELGDGTYNNTNRPEKIVAGGVTAVAAGGSHTLFVKNDGSMWAMGANGEGQLGDGVHYSIFTPFDRWGTNRPEQIVVNPAYNQISSQLLRDGAMQLSFVGIAGTNYALDYSFSLSPANWLPLLTNTAGVGGVLVFTNTPDATANNFWRIRSLP